MVDVTLVSKNYHKYKRQTTLSVAFLSAPNILSIRDAVEAKVRQEFGHPFVVVVTDELIEKMTTALDHNLIYSCQPEIGLPTLNNSIICEEVGMHIMSLRQRLRYFRYFINEDRQRTLTYPGMDHPTRGETVVETAESYVFKNPWRRLLCQYNREVNTVNATPN